MQPPGRRPRGRGQVKYEEGELEVMLSTEEVSVPVAAARGEEEEVPPHHPLARHTKADLIAMLEASGVVSSPSGGRARPRSGGWQQPRRRGTAGSKEHWI